MTDDFGIESLPPVEDVPAPFTATVGALLERMGRTGFQAKSLAQCATVWERMAEEDGVIMLGLAGSLSTTGQSQLVRWLIRERLVDLVVSTGANLTEDLLPGLGFPYRQGSHVADDADLARRRIDRFYDVYASEWDYRAMEDLLATFLRDVGSVQLSSAGLLRLLGRFLGDRGIDSIVQAAYDAKVPIFSPALADCGLGVAAAVVATNGEDVPVLDGIADFVQLSRVASAFPVRSVVYLGGGVPKDTLQLTAVLADLVSVGAQSPHRHAIQITTDSPQWGGLSGCTLEEAVSWGKIDPEGESVTCHCDVSIALPLICYALQERGVKRAIVPDVSSVLDETVRA